MKSSTQEHIEHHDCPENVAEELRIAGGVNRFGEPNFRCVWGWNRIVPITGEWQEFEQVQATLRDKFTGYSESRVVTQLKSSVIETRMVPKYMPANAFHLEMWRPPEEYGTPEQWGKAGEEVIGLQTVDTAGPFPSRGEYELCYPITHDGTSHGQPIPLIPAVVAEIVRMIVYGRNSFSLAQRRAAIEQELVRKEEGFVRTTQDVLKNSLRPFAGESFIVAP
jgi:hypothetical protein